MKLDTVSREAESSGFMEEKSFTIAANGKAFRILIDKMYSNVHQAIVRELMTNAWDAHIMVQNTKPFEIHIPSVFEPYFSIRDFGCAMTHDQVMNVYSTIFESTKDARDDQVGAWGLGSKTPFAYTDTFGVQVWQLGRHRVYNVFIDVTGVPKIALALEEENDGASDGVEISFPVAPKDSGLFRTAIETVSVGFDPRPVFSSPITIPTLKKKQNGQNWFSFETSSHAWLNKPLARVGCVLYPINFDAVYDYIISNKLNIEFINLLTARNGFKSSLMMVDFPIGSIEVTANREDLYYSAKTVKAIIERFTDILAEMQCQILDVISTGKTLYEVNMKCCNAIHLYDNVASSISKFLNDYVSTLTFRGRKLLKVIQFKHRSVKVEIGKDPLGAPLHKSVPTSYKSIEFVSYPVERFRKKSGVKFKAEELMIWAPEPTDVYVELANEKGKFVTFAGARIRNDRHAKDSTNKKGLIWIRTPSLLDRDFIKMMCGLGHPEYVIVNGLEKPVGAYSGDRSLAPIRYLDLESNDWYSVDDFDPENDSGYYVMLSNGIPEHARYINLGWMVTTLIEKGALPDQGKILGIPKSRKAVLKHGDSWEELLPAVKTAFRGLLDVNQATLQFSIDGCDMDSHAQGKIEKLQIGLGPTKLKTFDPDGPFAKAIAANIQLTEIASKASEFKSLWSERKILDYSERQVLEEEYGKLASDPILIAELRSLTDTIKDGYAAYPLFSQVYNIDSAMDDFGDYIKAMDILRKVSESAQSTISLDNSENAGHIDKLDLTPESETNDPS